jgi:hypothetical protein
MPTPRIRKQRKRKATVRQSDLPVLDDEAGYEGLLLPHCQLFALNVLLAPAIFTMADLIAGARKAQIQQGHIYAGKTWRVHVGSINALKYAIMARSTDGDNKLRRIVQRPCSEDEAKDLIRDLSTRQRLYITGKANTSALQVRESGLGIDHACAIIDGFIHDVNLASPLEATREGLEHVFVNIGRIYYMV